MADEDVLGDREVREEPWLLVNDGDPELARMGRALELNWYAMETEVAGIWLVDARQDLDERAFAGAVFADQGMDFGRVELERDAVERLGCAEAHRDAVELYRGGAALLFHARVEDSARGHGCPPRAPGSQRSALAWIEQVAQVVAPKIDAWMGDFASGECVCLP